MVTSSSNSTAKSTITKGTITKGTITKAAFRPAPRGLNKTPKDKSYIPPKGGSKGGGSSSNNIPYLRQSTLGGNSKESVVTNELLDLLPAEDEWSPRLYRGNSFKQKIANKEKMQEHNMGGGVARSYSNYNGFKELSITEKGSILDHDTAAKVLDENTYRSGVKGPLITYKSMGPVTNYSNDKYYTDTIAGDNNIAGDDHTEQHGRSSNRSSTGRIYIKPNHYVPTNTSAIRAATARTGAVHIQPGQINRGAIHSKTYHRQVSQNFSQNSLIGHHSSTSTTNGGGYTLEAVVGSVYDGVVKSDSPQKLAIGNIPSGNVIELSKRCLYELNLKMIEKKLLDKEIGETKKMIEINQKKIERQKVQNRMVCSECIVFEKDKSKIIEEIELMERELLGLDKEVSKLNTEVSHLIEDNSKLSAANYESVKTLKEVQENCREAKKVYKSESECRKNLVHVLRHQTLQLQKMEGKLESTLQQHTKLNNQVMATAIKQV